MRDETKIRYHAIYQLCCHGYPVAKVAKRFGVGVDTVYRAREWALKESQKVSSEDDRTILVDAKRYRIHILMTSISQYLKSDEDHYLEARDDLSDRENEIFQKALREISRLESEIERLAGLESSEGVSVNVTHSLNRALEVVEGAIEDRKVQ